ncbi:TetR/AcrR family transcriptional regulator [Reichenbachiella versicolor]|uniref:TetR/AcrR family transcriptional regulator n=1 Tax=Reichenbachiella versicolor TaxID=1821036 RepID=UPI000D6E0C82|nr:TetR/AcrR family transcriptional regulator [Reichenbachiella versicolor]
MDCCEEESITSNSRRRVLVDLAFEEFRKNGFINVRMDDLARKAGISKKTIYCEFTSKDQLINLYIKNIHDELQSEILTVFDSSLSSNDRWKFLVNRYCKFSLNISETFYNDLFKKIDHYNLFMHHRNEFINNIISYFPAEYAHVLSVYMYAYATTVLNTLCQKVDGINISQLEDIIVPFYEIGFHYLKS